MKITGLATFLAALLATGCQKAVKPPAAATDTVRILQFYAEGKIAKGEKGKLCYGVENAKTVRMQPAVAGVWPAYTRCVDVSPEATTTYTLTAEGTDGKTVSQKVTIEMGPPKPKIIEVSVNKMEITRGEVVVICYKAKNAASVDTGGLRPAPGLATPPSPSFGCVADKPQKTKTYTVRISGPGGEDSETLTVKVL